jgi:hypothetical protein
MLTVRVTLRVALSQRVTLASSHRQTARMASTSTLPTWYSVQTTEPEPVLRIQNTLTRSKVQHLLPHRGVMLTSRSYCAGRVPSQKWEDRQVVQLRPHCLQSLPSRSREVCVSLATCASLMLSFQKLCRARCDSANHV